MVFSVSPVRFITCNGTIRCSRTGVKERTGSGCVWRSGFSEAICHSTCSRRYAIEIWLLGLAFYERQRAMLLQLLLNAFARRSIYSNGKTTGWLKRCAVSSAKSDGAVVVELH